jgi:hypothetical protein
VLKFAFMKPETKKKHTVKRGHPWDTIFRTPELETDFGETEKELSLSVWARRVANEEPYSNVGLFRKTVVIKLRTLRYRPPDSKTEGETFERILRTASVLKSHDAAYTGSLPDSFGSFRATSIGLLGTACGQDRPFACRGVQF